MWAGEVPYALLFFGRLSIVESPYLKIKMMNENMIRRCATAKTKVEKPKFRVTFSNQRNPSRSRIFSASRAT